MDRRPKALGGDLVNFFLIISIILFSFANYADDKPLKLERRFSLSSGYFDTVFNSNEGLVNFPLSGIQAYSMLFDVVEKNFSKHGAIKLLTVTAELPVSYWLAHSFFMPFHEFGHARSYAASGAKYSFGTQGYGRQISGLNFWTLSAMRILIPPFGFPGQGMAWARSEGNGSISSSLEQFWGPSGYGIIRSASGLNNQMFLAKRIADNIYNKNGHMIYLQHYIGSKISAFIYTYMDKNVQIGQDSKSDIGAILNGYAQKGYNIRPGDLKLQSLLSLASGTTFSLLRAYYDYFAHDNKIARPAQVYGFRIPDINSYINANGLSLEIDTGYRVSPSLSAGLSYEFIWKGDFEHQLTPKVRFDLALLAPVINELWLGADLVIGRGLGGSFNAEYAPFALDTNNFWSRFSYSAGTNVYNAYTLFGERNITSLTNNKTVALSADVAVHLRY